jgi:hypothetical protein
VISGYCVLHPFFLFTECVATADRIRRRHLAEMNG